jgi:hypothetical protein
MLIRMSEDQLIVVLQLEQNAGLFQKQNSVVMIEKQETCDKIMRLPRDCRDWSKSSVDIVLRPSRLHFLAMSKVIVMMKSVVTF